MRLNKNLFFVFGGFMANGKVGRPKGLPKYGGRKKGTPNKITSVSQDVRRTIFEAFNLLGGVEYLVNVGRTEPKTFCGLLARVLPTEISGPNGGPIQTQQVHDLSKLSDEDLRKLEIILTKAAQS